MLISILAKDIKSVCYICKHDFKSQYSLRRHLEGQESERFDNIKISNGKKPPKQRNITPLDENKDENQSKEIFGCCCCYDLFRSIEEFKTHVTKEHLIVRESSETNCNEVVELPTIQQPYPLEADAEIISPHLSKMTPLQAASECLGVNGVLAETMISMINITKLKPMILRDSTNSNNNMIAYTSSKNLKRHLQDDDINTKRFKLETLEESSTETSCEHVTSISSSPILNRFVQDSPYRNILAFDSFSEITTNRIIQLNYSWRNRDYLCQFVGTLLCGTILIDGNKSLLVNGVEVYSRYRTLDAHHEHFSGNYSENSLPMYNNRYKADIRITSMDGKLMIGTKMMDALVISSIRIDTDIIPPEVGPFTRHFIPSNNTSIFLSNKSITKSNEILNDKVYNIQPEQDLLSNLKQVESKFDKQSTYNICRFHYMHTDDLTSQPYTLYTLADCDTISESDSILGSQLFQSVALGVYRSNKLKRASITRLLEYKSKKTSVVKSMEKILLLFEVDELEIIGNTNLNTILKDIASVIVTNGLKAANEKTQVVIWNKFKSYT